MEKLAPFVVQEDAVGLDGIDDLLPLRPELILQSDRPAEEVDAHQGGFPALPSEADLGQCGGLCGNVLPGHLLQNLRRHPERFGIGIQLILIQIETVAAIQITYWTDRLDKQVEWSSAQFRRSFYLHYDRVSLWTGLRLG